MIIQFAVAFAATFGFSVIFFAPRRLYIACAAGGGLTWIVYLLLSETLGAEAPAIFAAAFALTVYARLCGRVFKAPAIIFLIVGVFPLAPGAAIYNMANALFASDLIAASAFGVQALTTAGAVALGTLFGYTIPALYKNKKKAGAITD